MNKAQKEVIDNHLTEEDSVLSRLKKVYEQAISDCEMKIRELSMRKDMENLQSIVYQKKYQEVLKKQLEGIVDTLRTGEYTTISEYLTRSYNNGFIGVMYDLSKSGIPVIAPIDQEQIVQAIQVESKLSQGLYDRLGEDTNQLKKAIQAELSRGIANGSTWNEIAEGITMWMNSPFKKAYGRAATIARTEGHRIQQKSAMDAQRKAKEAGSGIKKQWDSTLDKRTRPAHQKMDGQIRETEERFSNGLMYPGDPSGAAAEVVNCRCQLLQRADWELDEDELDELKKRAAYFGLDKVDDFQEFRKKYLNAVENAMDSDIMKSDLGVFKQKLRDDKGIDKEYYSVLKDRFSHGSKEAKAAFTKYVPENSVVNSTFEDVATFNPKTKQISMHYGMDMKNERGAGVTWFHEHGHLIDDAVERISDDDNFMELLLNDARSYRMAYGKQHGLKTWDKVDRAISKELNDMKKHSGVSDMLDGLTKGNIKGIAGHKKEYWENKGNITAEAFAHMYEAQFDAVRYEQMKKYFPDSLKYFEKKLKEIAK